MRLIDADALAENWFYTNDTGTKVVELLEIEEAPTIDALPLRCRIGDTVWVVGTKCLSGLHESECVLQYGCRSCPLDQEYIVFPHTVSRDTFLYIHNLDTPVHFRWGETVFETKEEAEAALSERKATNED